MCTSIVTNFKNTIIGWNLDLLDMTWKVVAEKDKVYIAILDKKEGWLPLFGANDRGEFVAMPTCWPYDKRSDPKNEKEKNIINLDIDLLTKKTTFDKTVNFVKSNDICSVPGVTFQAQLSDKNGNVLQVIPGQGYKFFERPKYSILTNFSPFKMDKEIHPWMGLDRYNVAKELLEQTDENFAAEDMFEILKRTSQTICPTIVTMVFDVKDKTIYWCENRQWGNINKKTFA